MSPSQIEYLRHILDEIEYLSKHSSNLPYDKFINDETLKRAYIRSLEIIGEAAKIPALERQIKKIIQFETKK